MFSYFRSQNKRTTPQPGSFTALDTSSTVSPTIRSPSLLHQPTPFMNVGPPNEPHGTGNSRRQSHPNNSYDMTDDSEVPSEFVPTVSLEPPRLPPIPRIASVYDRIDGSSGLDLKEACQRFGQESSSGVKMRAAGIESEAAANMKEQSVGQHNSPFAEDVFKSISSKHSPSDASATAVASRDSSEKQIAQPAPQIRDRDAAVSPGARPTQDVTVPNFSWVSRSSAPIPISPPKMPVNQPMKASPSRFPTDSHRKPPIPPIRPSTQIDRNPHASRPPPQIPLPPLPYNSDRQEKGYKRHHTRNPVSRLLRRRGGGPSEQISEGASALHRSNSHLPDNFDPSIRGKVVHDFSAPRVRRNVSADTVASAHVATLGDAGVNEDQKRGLWTLSKTDAVHTPVFREHFDPEEVATSINPNVRAEQLANTDFVNRHSQHLDKVLPLPPFARTPPPEDNHRQHSPSLTGGNDKRVSLEAFPDFDAGAVEPSNATNHSLPTVSEDENISPADSLLTTPTKNNKHWASPANRSRATSKVSIGEVGSTPGRMASKSSRFSFQLANVDSQVQEKLLEERHTRKVAANAANHTKSSKANAEDEVEEEPDFDDDFDMDGYEEDVPTVGDDWDYGGVGMGLGNLTLEDTLSSRDHPHSEETEDEDSADAFTNFSKVIMPQGLGIVSPITETMPERHDKVAQHSSSVKQGEKVFPQKRLNDEFYFDDGEIGDAEHDEEQPFDESVFDNPAHDLYERKQKANQPLDDPDRFNRNSQESDLDVRNPVLVPQNSQRMKRSRVPGDIVLPVLPPNMGNIVAYHQALAQAANKAAAEGRFNRQNSVDAPSENLSSPRHPIIDTGKAALPDTEPGASRSSPIPDETRVDAGSTTFSSSQSPSGNKSSDSAIPNASPHKAVLFDLPSASEEMFSSDFDMSDYDSAFEDDPMIAAANAEALAYDEEGTYGREFGFYARPAPNGHSQQQASAADADPAVFTNGGYFGPKDWGEIKRQRSLREPNLTPITERSEFSTRNSFIGVPPLSSSDRSYSGFNLANNGQPSPNLAALARMSSPTWDGDMNIGALLRLRNKAFGGSQSSLNSASGSSPVTSSPAAYFQSAPSPGFLQVGRDPRTLWSSPVARQVEIADYMDVNGSEGYNFHDDGLIDEANLVDEEDEEDIDHDDGFAQTIDVNSPASLYSPLVGFAYSHDPLDEDEDDGANNDNLDMEEDNEPTQRAFVTSGPGLRSRGLIDSSPGQTDEVDGIDIDKTPIRSRPHAHPVLNLNPIQPLNFSTKTYNPSPTKSNTQPAEKRPTSLPSPFSSNPTSPAMANTDRRPFTPVSPLPLSLDHTFSSSSSSTINPDRPISSDTISFDSALLASPVSPLSSHSQPNRFSIDSLKPGQNSTTGTSSSSDIGSIGPLFAETTTKPAIPSGNNKPQRQAHRRTGSDSVTYVRELDERSGDVKWILERRRTSEFGVELLQREVVEGGRI